MHLYHLYADSEYEDAATEHFTSLNKYGLGKYIDKFYIGLVGKPINRKKALRFVNKFGYNPKVITKVESGYEYETLSKLPELIENFNGYVLYAHTKGSSFSIKDPHMPYWRAGLNYYNIEQWKRQIKALENNYDTAGAYWLNEPELKNERFFAGTYWWANSKYLKTLSKLTNENRYTSERWIGLNKDVKYFDADKYFNDYNKFKIWLNPPNNQIFFSYGGVKNEFK